MTDGMQQTIANPWINGYRDGFADRLNADMAFCDAETRARYFRGFDAGRRSRMKQSNETKQGNPERNTRYSS